MSQRASESTLYDHIGGEAAARVAIDRFYERVLADPELQGFFTSVNMSRLKAHQFAFLSQVLGNPRQYSGASMRDAHHRLAIEQRHFDGVAAHLVTTCASLESQKESLPPSQARLHPYPQRS